MWMTPKQVSEYTEYSEKTLANWRSKRIGPAYSKPPGSTSVRYRQADVEAWLQEGMQ